MSISECGADFFKIVFYEAICELDATREWTLYVSNFCFAVGYVAKRYGSVIRFTNESEDAIWIVWTIHKRQVYV